MFQDLGADGVVSGGQTMNPSTESILEGVDRIPAETVFILPNNSNIIMAAQQCGALTEKNVVVIPTKTVPQGITAMMNVDFEAPDADSITQAMTEALSTVTTAQITYAARNSDFDGFDIKEGDYLALEEGRLFGTDGDLNGFAGAAGRGCRGPGRLLHLPCTSARMCPRPTPRRQASSSRIAARMPRWPFSPGGQPVYYYIISME